MLYVEDISALQFWLSTARVVLDDRQLPRLSSLADCPKTSRESSWHAFDGVPYEFDHPIVAIPGEEFRAQRKRFRYHVWSRDIPPKSFLRITHDVAIASPELAIVQAAKRIRNERLAQAICSLAGTYITVPGKHAGMIDELTPLVTIDEIRMMARELSGIHSSRHLDPALRYAAENSASPGETKLLLLCTMPKCRGGLATSGWQMNLEMDVPYKLQKYLGQSRIKPDLISLENDLILEYDSDEHHNTLEQRAKDEKRRTVFQTMGYKTIPVYTHQVRNSAQFEPVAREILEAFGRKRTKSTESQLYARDRLIASLRDTSSLT